VRKDRSEERKFPLRRTEARADSARRSESYWEIVGAQFRKNRVATAALWAVKGLVLLAVFAPLLAFDRPYFTAAGGKLEWPLFSSLLDRNVFESGVDVFFNLLLLTSPVLGLVWFVARRLAGRGRRRARILLLACAAAGFGFLFVSELSSPRRRPYRDLGAEIEKIEREGGKVAVLFPPIPYSYSRTDVAGSTRPPSREHWLGTDSQGRDVLARLIYGTRISLTIGVVAVSIYSLIGIVVGSLAGFFGGWVDLVLSRFVEVMICFPTFFLILTIIGLIEHRSIFHIMVVIGLTGWTQVARLIRGEVLRIRELDYVQAAVAQGIRRRKIIFGHILPNAVAPVLVAATFGIARAILVESGLAFLGLGDPSAPSWGELLTMGRLAKCDWLILSPGMAIFFVVLVFNLVGEGLRDALDPRLRT